jgi:hypothetical protein
MRIVAKLWVGLAILIIFSPLGLLLPEHFKSGAAWGEWGVEEVQKLVGYIPKGLKKLSSLWNAPMPDYVFKGWEEKGLSQASFAYIISAIIGIVLIILLVFLIGRFLARKGE